MEIHVNILAHMICSMKLECFFDRSEIKPKWSKFSDFCKTSFLCNLD